MTPKPKKERMNLSALRAAKKGLDPNHGLRCPECGCPESSVYRTTQKLDKIIRERICGNCKRQFLTRETVACIPDETMRGPTSAHRTAESES